MATDNPQDDMAKGAVHAIDADRPRLTPRPVGGLNRLDRSPPSAGQTAVGELEHKRAVERLRALGRPTRDPLDAYRPHPTPNPPVPWGANNPPPKQRQ